jgi:hypothetical protein
MGKKIVEPPVGLARIQPQMEEAMLEIKVLGDICGDCLKMEQVVLAALKELRIDNVAVECICGKHVLDHGLQTENTPGLMIEGFLAWAGSVPAKEQVMELIQKAVTPTVI